MFTSHILLLGILCIARVSATGFEYSDEKNWPGTCQTGKRQSPIDISLSEIDEKHIEPFEFHNYDVGGKVLATNNGHTEMMKGFDTWAEKPYITGGGLQGKYFLQQFHFHWGGIDRSGSEHTFNGMHYPLELHFVHMREGLTDATVSSQPEGMAVLAVLFDVSNNGEALANLTAAIQATQDIEEAKKAYYRPSALLPSITDVFYRYEGSLTTPPCTEDVVWTIFSKPNYVTEEQVNLLRKHLDDHEVLLLSNWRDTQPLNGRRITLSNRRQFTITAPVYKHKPRHRSNTYRQQHRRRGSAEERD